MNRRPIVIEFTGKPCSGKTTLIRGLNSALSLQGFDVEIVQEHTKNMPNFIPEKGVEINQILNFDKLQPLFETNKIDADFVLIDRGFCDTLFWTKFLFLENICTSKEYFHMYEILKELNNQYNLLPDWLFVLDVTLDEAVIRSEKRHTDVTFSTSKFLHHSLRSGLYRQVLEDFSKTVKPGVWYLDTTDLDICSMIDTAQYKVEQLWKKK